MGSGGTGSHLRVLEGEKANGTPNQPHLDILLKTWNHLKSGLAQLRVTNSIAPAFAGLGRPQQGPRHAVCGQRSLRHPAAALALRRVEGRLKTRLRGSEGLRVRGSELGGSHQPGQL